jgi:hypothetical protein
MSGKERPEIGYGDFVTTLMRLEIQGKIQVTRLKLEEKWVTLKSERSNKQA